MNSLRISVRRAGSVFAALALVLSTALPGIVSAAQVTERSIALSTSAAGADNVTYQVNFTPVAAADQVLINFCTNSPLIGASCTAPDAGFSVSSAAAAGVDSVVGSNTNDTIIVTDADGFSAGVAKSIAITGINNPDTAGALYARVLTYDGTDASTFTDATDPGDYIDDGGVAISITPTIAVSGAVLESMTFCVTGGQAPEENCDTSDPAVTAPTLKLGQDVGGVIALNSADTYEGTIYTQLSTNAASGAIVNLKSDSVGCGGLSREGASSIVAGCAIAPALAATFNDGEAKFGVRLGTAAGVGTSGGTYRIYDSGSGAYYSTSALKLNYVDNTEGVTSTYGDPILDSNGAPVNNMNMPVIFGASAANNTPAGNYRANLSLIATGKF